ncbi:reverse transcriptase [Phytophthora megakarya]|uniref:Reverse transcriptase n=1 Tax=Phytophthora megakarya TaxID=4795 RepID=A0A225WBR9_9STRA|nr:reverse transcriptase [Phytophthora megakarya]
MVRVPGSSGDSGFHRESQEDVKIKEEYREEADLDQDPDLEEKPQISLKAAAAVTADLDEKPDPYITDKDTTKSKSNLSTKSAVSTCSTKKKKIKAARSKLKAPDSGSEAVHKSISTIATAKDLIEQAYYRKILSKTLLHDPVLAIIQVRQIGDLTGPISKPNISTDRLNAVRILLDLLQDAGVVAGEFDPDALFEMELGAIQAATQDLYESLKILVGEHVQTPDLNYQTGSSHYASVTSEPDSHSPRAPQRMSLVPSGAKYMRSRASRLDQRPAGPSRSPEKPDRQEERLIPTIRVTPTCNSTGYSNKLDEYFQMAMNRFLKELSLVAAQPPLLGTQDIDMESVGTPDPHSWEYDPDDLGIPNSFGHNSGRAAVASAAIGSGGSSLIPRVRISAISDLKEFTGKDMDEDRAIAWIGKVKSEFQRDQATEEEKCLTFADLMVSQAKNWHRQLSRTTKTKWADLLESFQTQYCGLAEDLEVNLAVLPEIPISTTAKVSIEDLFGHTRGDREALTDHLEETTPPDRKGNTLPPAAKGVVCDINVRNAKPIALRTRKVPMRFRENVAGLIKGILAAEIIRSSTSPWASPIVIIARVNVDLLEDLDKALWYCSLDMASGFWVVPVTDRAREISAFITPFGLFEWSRRTFGLKNAPQIYQRLVDNALYGCLKVSRSGDAGATTDVFQTGIADDPDREAEDLLEACDKWNLSISVAKRFWGMDKVGYLGHRVLIGGLKASPKDLKSLTYLLFPGSLRSMHSFLGSLNYYSRFIEDYAIYASVLYELREVEFAELEKRSDLTEIMDRNDPIPRDHGPPILKLTVPGRLGQWSALLAPWTLEITTCMKGEDKTLGSIAASITPRAKMDDDVAEIAPWKEPKRRIQAPIPTVQKMPVYQDLVILNRLDEVLIPRTENPVVRVAAVTTRAARARSPAGVMQEGLIRGMQVDRIKQAPKEEVWMAGMKKYLSGSIADLTQAEARSYGKIVADYEVDEQDLLFYCPPTPRLGNDRDRLLRLVANARLKEAIADRADRQNEDVGSHQIEAAYRVWLYLDRMKEGYARKSAHLWHGPFRVAEKINEFSVKLEIAGTGYQIFPVVHMSKLKLVKDFPDRPQAELTVDEAPIV